MKILLISLGCDKNLVDSEMMLGILSERGYEITNDVNMAQVVVVNTCCFIGDAKQESINMLLEMAELKKSGQIKALLAAGCLAQRYCDEIRKEIPQVDAVIGVSSFDKICEAIDDVLQDKQTIWMDALNRDPISGKKRVLSTGGHFAYLKIAEGCDKRCTYCIIPKVRGNYRSVPMETLFLEAKELAQRGVKELILVAQETTLYGKDLYGKKMLPELMQKLASIEEIAYIRLLYCYPEEITRDMIDVMKKEPKICHYLDMPVQHASDHILKRMGRKTNKKDLVERIATLRAEIPDICIRTTLITGFPGENLKDFRELKRFVKEMRFDRLGVFAYSREEETAAARMRGQIPDIVKKLRRSAIMRIQQKIAFEKAQEMEGRHLTVFIEGRLPEDNVYVGRTYKDAPNVDGYIFVKCSRERMTGDIINAVVTGAHEYDLIGEEEDEFTE